MLAMHLPAIFSLMVLWLHAAAQQTISTSMPVPPLQWLNLKGLTAGSPPPPLKDSSIGYDENTRTLIIFGGESQAGLPQQGTYLLNLDSLTWSQPVTKVATQTSTPPARSRALGTGDFAANSRRDFIIFGGKGPNNKALGDVWAFDYLNQFWVNVDLSPSTQPQPRWGALGGIDQSVIPGSGNNVNTTFYIVGGSDSTQTFPSSDLWQLVITGTLASDVATIQGQWEETPLASKLAGKSEAGGGLISKNQAPGARIIISGGCGANVSPSNANANCTDPSTYVLTVGGSSFSASQCPTPRLGPAIVPNLNPSSSSFASQAFMLLGTFNSSQWNDENGLNKGEVAVLDADAGTWSRILPAGDPSSAGGGFPTPRQGAAAFAFPSALVGTNRQSSSDTIIFGGEDSKGNVLNDLWVLRAYNGSISQSGEHWQGFGNGNLQSGIGASGAGVTVNYLSQCAQQLTPIATTTSSSPSSTTGTQTNQPSQTSPAVSSNTNPFDVSIVHRALSPVSIALALAATFLSRLSVPDPSAPPDRYLALVYIAIPIGVVAYSIGVAGFAISITSTTLPTSQLQQRAEAAAGTFLKTGHGKAGFALFIGLYGVVPILAVCVWLAQWRGRGPAETPAEELFQKESGETGAMITAEKDTSHGRSVSPSHSAPEVHTAPSSMRHQRALSGPGLFPGWRGRTVSEVSEPGPSTRGFEVVNRPRRASGGTALYPTRDRTRHEVARSLGDISWLERRRSVSAVGELDYALSQLPHASPRSVSPPATSRPPTVTMSNRPFVRTPTPMPTSPSQLTTWDYTLHILFHIFLLANCILALVALFSRAPLATFIVFLLWTVAFYTSLIILAWHGKPRTSILTIIITRLRAPIPIVSPTSPSAESPAEVRSTMHSPPPGGGPYIYHQPPWRRAVSPEEDVGTRTSHGGRNTVEADDDPDDDVDDDDRQRHMEEELMRRDVNIVTVPRRRLWIANPS